LRRSHQRESTMTQKTHKKVVTIKLPAMKYSEALSEVRSAHQDSAPRAISHPASQDHLTSPKLQEGPLACARCQEADLTTFRERVNSLTGGLTHAKPYRTPSTVPPSQPDRKERLPDQGSPKTNSIWYSPKKAFKEPFGAESYSGYLGRHLSTKPTPQAATPTNNQSRRALGETRPLSRIQEGAINA
jgi:hypothetical protein